MPRSLGTKGLCGFASAAGPRVCAPACCCPLYRSRSSWWAVLNVRSRKWAELQKSSSCVIADYVCPEGLGGVCAVVGAWGNIGAVAWGMMFKFGYIGNFEQGYIAMGYIIIASSVFTIFMRIKGQSSVLCGDQ